MRIDSRLTPKLVAGDLLRGTRRHRQHADNDAVGSNPVGSLSELRTSLQLTSTIRRLPDRLASASVTAMDGLPASCSRLRQAAWLSFTGVSRSLPQRARIPSDRDRRQHLDGVAEHFPLDAQKALVVLLLVMRLNAINNLASFLLTCFDEKMSEHSRSKWPKQTQLPTHVIETHEHAGDFNRL